MKKFFLFFIIAFLSLASIGFADSWHYADWHYRRPISIDNTQLNQGLSEYTLLINVTYDSNMQSDFDDLRFTYGIAETEIPYWIENKVDDQYAVLWIKIPYISASGYEDLYMYYGNPVASSESDIGSTWLAGDDFDDNTFNYTCWNITRTDEYGNPNTLIQWNEGISKPGELHIKLSGGVTNFARANAWFNYNCSTISSDHVRVRTRFNYSLADNRHYVQIVSLRNKSEPCGVSGAGAGTYCADKFFIAEGKFSAVQYNNIIQNIVNGSWAANVTSLGINQDYYMIHEFLVNDSSSWKYADDILNVSWVNNQYQLANPNSYVGSMLISDLSTGYIEGWYDWFAIGKYYYPEPTYSIGEEETIPTPEPECNCTELTEKISELEEKFEDLESRVETLEQGGEVLPHNHTISEIIGLQNMLDSINNMIRTIICDLLPKGLLRAADFDTSYCQ